MTDPRLSPAEMANAIARATGSDRRVARLMLEAIPDDQFEIVAHSAYGQPPDVVLALALFALGWIGPSEAAH